MKTRIIWVGTVLLAAGVSGWAAWQLLGTDTALRSTGVVVAPDGHAFRYVAAPNIRWEEARDAAARQTWKGHRGYLATIDDATQYQFVVDRLFPTVYPDVTYLGGRQTAPGEWRWVTGPEGKADGGKGTLFWRGDEQGTVEGGHYANWMSSAFQHGGKWDMSHVCCVTIFSYSVPQFSTSLGNGDTEEHVDGYIVEFGGE
jgi:hypothetical protein